MTNLLTAALYLLMFIFGAAVGSFILVVTRRSIAGRDWVREPSRCESCGKRLKWWELIPFFSYAALGGRCSSCGTEIGADHFICEGWLGAAFAVSLRLFAERPALLAACLALHAVMTALTARALLRGRGLLPSAALYLAALLFALTLL